MPRDNQPAALEHLVERRAGGRRKRLQQRIAVKIEGWSSIDQHVAAGEKPQRLSPFLRRFLILKLWLIEKLRFGERQVTLVWAAVIGILGALVTEGFRRLRRLEPESRSISRPGLGATEKKSRYSNALGVQKKPLKDCWKRARQGDCCRASKPWRSGSVSPARRAFVQSADG